MIQKIINSADPRLRKISKRVVKIDKKILLLIEDMWETLLDQKDPEGVGLAAPQIGKNLRIFIMQNEGVSRTVINPEIISKSKVKNKGGKEAVLEGCLSIPHYYGPLTRSEKVELKYKNKEGKNITEKFEGFLAQIVLHEIDHLDGILFVDKLLSQDKPLYKQGKDGSWEEVGF